MLMDFDPGIAGIASQPFWLHWQDEDGRSRRHAPDFFARRSDGGGLVVDVRPDERIPPEDAEVFRMTAMACGQAGWEFRRAGTIDPVVRANIRWLSRYRHHRCRREPAATELLEAFTPGMPLLPAAAQVGGGRMRLQPRGPGGHPAAQTGLAGLPPEAVERARWWEGHIIEVVNGTPPDAPAGTPPRPAYDV